jgi:site-specific recombinase XerD
MDPEVPLKELLDRFERDLAAAGKSANTLLAYTRDLRLFGEWFELTNAKSLSPNRITPIDVREYRSHLLDDKQYRPATVNRKLASLAAFCEWARETGLIPANPVQGISLVEEVRPAPRWLDKNAQYALLRAVQERGKTRDIALITLMLHTGLRVSEVSNLRMGDIRISPRGVSVRVRGGKGEKFRSVPLNVDARKAVQAYLEELGEVEGARWLFMGKRGERLKSSGIRYLVECYAYDARLEEVTPHTLRHTFGKNMVDAARHWTGWPVSWATRVSTPPGSTPPPASRTCSGRWRRWPWSRGDRGAKTPQERERGLRARSNRRHSAVIWQGELQP